MLPSWDLLIITFSSTIVIYSFFIGKKQLLKIIFAGYMSALASDGAGNLFTKYVLLPPDGEAVADLKYVYLTVLFKIIIFVVLTIMLSLHSKINIDFKDSDSGLINMISTIAFGFLCSLIIISTIIAYATGGGFIFAEIAKDAGLLKDVASSSTLLSFFIRYGSVTFLVPVLVFIFYSFDLD